MIFFKKSLWSIQGETCDPVEIEEEATRLGLPVLDPEEIVLGIDANFGVVEAIKSDGAARVLILDDTRESTLDDIIVPVSWIPRAFREEGAGIAWVERKYRCGVKGRFEPGSMRSEYE